MAAVGRRPAAPPHRAGGGQWLLRHRRRQPPPLEQFYFPVGLKVSHGGTVLYAVNSNFDLQYNGGTLQSYDLRLIRQHAVLAIEDPTNPNLPLIRPRPGFSVGMPGRRRRSSRRASPGDSRSVRPARRPSTRRRTSATRRSSARSRPTSSCRGPPRSCRASSSSRTATARARRAGRARRSTPTTRRSRPATRASTASSSRCAATRP